MFCYRSRQMRWERSVRARDLTRRWRHLVVRNRKIINYGVTSCVWVVPLCNAMMPCTFSVLKLPLWARRLLWGHQQWRLHLRLHRTVPGTHVCHKWEPISTCTCTSSSKTPTVSCFMTSLWYVVVISCFATPCQHGGTCGQSVSTGQYVCLCEAGYTGDHCETGELTPCLGSVVTTDHRRCLELYHPLKECFHRPLLPLRQTRFFCGLVDRDSAFSKSCSFSLLEKG